MMTGITRTKELPITYKQLKQWEDGMLAQQAFPNLNASDREFIISGITDEEWDSTFQNED